MPELPEVETVRRGLAPAMEGAVFTKVKLNRANLRFPFPKDFSKRICDRTVVALSRRAKYLVAELDSGEVLVMHLGMSGSFHLESDGENARSAEGKDKLPNRLVAHDHVIFDLACNGVNTGQCRIIYNDPRRFGFMDLIKADELAGHKYFANLGVEPTGNSLNGELLRQLFAGRKAPLKAALLDQKLIAGLGNIYVCEALWQAGLSPTRAAGSLAVASGLARKRADDLAEAVRDVIFRAIAVGGSTLNDHRQTDGSPGYFQHDFNAYDREGMECANNDCDGVIRRMVQSGRSTYYCRSCQK